MKIYRLVLMLVVLFVFVGYANAQSRAANNDGLIVEQVPKLFSDLPTYEQRVDIAKKWFAADESLKTPEAREEALKEWQLFAPKKDYEELKSQTQVEIFKIKYMSDGLKISGYIFKPKITNGKKYPVVIYNHGGNRNPIVLLDYLDCYRLAKQDFVVLASEYRGNGDSEGKEEFGGADVDDVMNLIPLAKSLGYVDMQNVFMLGYSRGSVMAFEAMKRNIPVNAVALYGTIPDFGYNIAQRPALIKTYKELIPDYDQQLAASFRSRSAIAWADQLNAPILMFHGGADQQAAVFPVLTFAQKLESLGNTYELIIYAGDDHGTNMHRVERENKTVEWFKKYMKVSK